MWLVHLSLAPRARHLGPGRAVVLLAGALAWTPPAHATTLVVTTVADDNGSSSASCLSGSGVCTLRGALAAASAGDTITFGVTGTILLANGTLTLTKEVPVIPEAASGALLAAGLAVTGLLAAARSRRRR
ncbi:MAG TPA: hypothetical protein VII06_08665 [Chloroflexota bacterium]|jgi:CSLREA domain-containing protein